MRYFITSALLLIGLNLSAQNPNIVLQFHVKTLTEWDGSKFSTQVPKKEMGGVFVSDSMFYLRIGNEINDMFAVYVDSKENLEFSYVEEKYYLNSEKYPHRLRPETAEYIVFMRRNLTDEDFFWVSMVEYPSKEKGLLFYKQRKVK